jgi:hypothetical protein
MAVFGSLTPPQQGGVVDYLSGTSGTDCYSALNYFPGDQATARRVIWRESRNTPTAQNSSSSAKGCWQIMQSIHASKYYAVGCTPSDWSDPVCNTKVAALLYQQVGWSPWASTV